MGYQTKQDKATISTLNSHCNQQHTKLIWIDLDLFSLILIPINPLVSITTPTRDIITNGKRINFPWLSFAYL